MKAVILFNELQEQASPDDQDVLAAVQAVSQSLAALGYQTTALPVSLDLQKSRAQLDQLRPLFVFNLVESLGGVGRFACFVPAVLEQMNIPFTGGSAAAMMLTTDKIPAKQRLADAGIPTPAWFDGSAQASLPDFPPPYIIKPRWEDASVGIDGESVINDRARLPETLQRRIERYGKCFVESYVDGREFNLSVLGDADGPKVLPAAEIVFRGFGERPRIVDYAAKWDDASFEYQNTVRSFEFDHQDEPLLQRLRTIAADCWNIFRCSGYARIDFRVNTGGEPLVLEVNVNPCISPDAGFPAAAARAGMTYTQMIERIVQDALRRGTSK